jgi:tRNA (cmo5U34)-methyltransferase
MPTEDGAKQFLSAFSDPKAIAQYADVARRFVPGLADLHRMTGLLLAERAPKDARVLVLGAGGGLELEALSEAYPDWKFVGVDPSEQMLALARQTLGSSAARAEFVHGYIDDASFGLFDAATCLLTLHFLDPVERRRTACEIRRRLKPGAPFVAAHSSFAQGTGERGLWLSRYAAYALASGADPDRVNKARTAVEASVQMLSPEQDEEILRKAGFSEVSLFFAAFTWRWWIAHA